MNYLGKELSDLLRRHGVPGPIIALHGGPSVLTVIYKQLNEEGHPFFDERGQVAVGVLHLSTHQTVNGRAARVDDRDRVLPT